MVCELKTESSNERDQKIFFPKETSKVFRPSSSDVDQFLEWLLGRSRTVHNVKLQSFNGWYNNKNRPDFGSSGTPLCRLTDVEKNGGSTHPPNPFEISKIFSENHKQEESGKNLLLLFFGESVVNELVDTRSENCPLFYSDIPIPIDHEYRKISGHTYMPFKRSSQKVSPNLPPKIINHASSWIDADSIYGKSKVINDQIRSYEKGKLKLEQKGIFQTRSRQNHPADENRRPDYNRKPISEHFAVGGRNGQENPFILSINMIWLKWHNIIAEKLSTLNPYWSDERVFHEARRWVIATQQQIITNEWLPLWIGRKLRPYEGYNPAIDPSISDLFSAAAMRFGHTMIPANFKMWQSLVNQTSTSEIYGSDHGSNTSSFRLCNSYFNTDLLKEENALKQIVLGMAFQSALSVGLNMESDIKTKVYGPNHFTRRDLVALNIQRGREYELPDYISARKAFNLPVYKDLRENAFKIWNVTNTEIVEKLESLYRNPEDLDLWIGGLMEFSPKIPGELFRSIILDQFSRIRDGDFFWFQNILNGIFDSDEIQHIETLTIRDILTVVLSLDGNLLQKYPFLVPNNQGNWLSLLTSLPTESFQCSVPGSSSQDLICYTLSSNWEKLEPCKPLQTLDYLKGNELYFISTFIVLSVVIFFWLILREVLIHRRKYAFTFERSKTRSARFTVPMDDYHIIAHEWTNRKEESQTVIVEMEPTERRLSVRLFSSNSRLLRRIDLRNKLRVSIESSTNPKKPLVSVKFENEHDLVLNFDSQQEKTEFMRKFERFLSEIGIGKELRDLEYKKVIKGAYTKSKRQRHLESFFRAIFANAFDIKPLKAKIDQRRAKEILRTELTKYEFAQSLAMRSDSLFVNQMFDLVDKDNNGYISFREFLDIMVIFAKGSSDQKAKIMFDMYDLDGTGCLSKEEFSMMIKSMLELANQSIEPQEMQKLIESMFRSAGIDSKSDLTLSDFLRFLGDFKDQFGYVELNLEVGELGKEFQASSKRQSVLARAHDKVFKVYSIIGQNDVNLRCDSKTDPCLQIETKQTHSQKTLFEGLTRFLDEKRWHIFWIFAFITAVIYLFVEKVIEYLYLLKHRQLNSIAGIGIAMTRGSASVMMFSFSLLLLTMSRNIITFLRETFLNFYVPFDASVSFHKMVAFTILIFSVIHSIGHFINFYNLLTQPPEDLECLMPSFYVQPHRLTTFQDWCFGTITGVTGILLVVLMSLIYIFSASRSRRFIFNWFWATHNLYPLVYFLIFLHGLGRLIQEPIFYKYLAIPLVLFKIDFLIRVSRKKMEIAVLKCVHYPSDVTLLELAKPGGFDFKSGQWVRISSTGLNSKEYHPFTIASAPHEEHLQLFIRAIGPFTRNIRKIYDPDQSSEFYPPILLDGPYGETHQDWFRYPVSVLVGGGIGVTPFASILKDIAYRSSTNHLGVCRKVYFLWVTRTQKHFEWLVDILRDLEERDFTKMVEVHIFITQFYEKFDLRTMMLYVCERHFQRISNRSLFTGLKAKTQFGRPKFSQFFLSMQKFYSKIDRIGVFSCGPSPMTRSVNQACEEVNRRKGALFISHSENF